MLEQIIDSGLVGAARAWLRYPPLRTGKKWLWDRFSWRHRDYRVEAYVADEAPRQPTPLGVPRPGFVADVLFVRRSPARTPV